MNKKFINELKEELNRITLVELATNKDNIQNDLTEISTIIRDFFSMINNHNRTLNLKNKGLINKGNKGVQDK